MATSSREEYTPLLASHAPALEVNRNTFEDDPSKLSNRFVFKMAAAMFSFAMLGLLQSSIGTLLPLISKYYDLSDFHVSLIFVVCPLGYILAAQTSSLIHHRSGQFGIAFIGPVLQMIAAGLLSLHNQFGLVLVGFAVQGLGMGLLDGSWCAWAGSMERASTVSGLLHSSFSAGAATAPILITLMTTNGHAWFEWYYVLGALSIIDAVALCTAFWNETASVHRQTHQSDESYNKAYSRAMLGFPATWWCAAYFLADVGVETAISGWIVSFMLRSRTATPYLAGLSSSGFWAGMAVGRLVLGPLTDRIGVRKATALYFALAISVETLFAILPYPVVSVVLMIVLGFLMGPLFPSGVIVLTQLLPKEFHVAAVSFVASLGQVGGALLPFGIGAVVEGLGIGVFRFAILVQSVLAMTLWIAFARLRPATSTFERSLAHED
ncbi:MFS general substrate transporter [Didymella exigua CBS 183.55]|uniref:MFS general substrate transporter n=1 Tax=Didymella exigua CBS 183.55 TaxID=1150837 RepID=A0A6A5RAY4_9PLEO|nr:MFS general substrate transporter [Didymella exigua CBS 183.55]KAF1924489.1 MFS general substrate transporter [Didymella exigua CBS 183.55]